MGALALLLFLATAALGFLSLMDRPWAGSESALQDGQALLENDDGDSAKKALGIFSEVAQWARTKDDKKSEAKARLGIGKAWRQLGQMVNAVEALDQARILSESLEAPALEADILNQLAWPLARQGKVEIAREYARKALNIARKAHYLRGEAEALNNLAILARRRSDLGRAWRYYTLSLDVWRGLEDPTGEAMALHNLGILLTQLDLLPEAIDVLEKAADIHREEGRRRLRGETLTALGWAHHWGPEPRDALPYYEEALEEFRFSQNVRGEAVLVDRRASTLLKLGRSQEAIKLGKESLNFFRAAGETIGEAAILGNIARAMIQEKRFIEALELLDESRLLFGESNQPSALAEVWFQSALARWGAGEPEKTFESLEMAIQLMESVPFGELSSAVRASYLSTLQDYFAAYIDILIESAQRFPEAGFERRILSVGERQRARGLLYDLMESEQALVEQNLEVQRQLYRENLKLSQAIQELESKRLTGLSDDDEFQTLRKERTLLLEAEGLIVEDLRHRGELPGYPQPIQPADAQRYIGRDTVALVYTLGAERTYLNIVTAEKVLGLELALRERVETTARRTLESLEKSWSERSKRAARSRGNDLSRLLIGTSEKLLNRSRILFVADGELQNIPFGYLPLPSRESSFEPLMAHFEVVGAPSLSVVAALLERDSSRSSSPTKLAVLADPVFSLQDSRVRRVASRTKVGSKADSSHRREDWGQSSLTRLASSGDEAKTILNLLPSDQRLGMVGFDATREAVLDGRLKNFDILHFATHTLAHPEQPELMGLMMSRFDRLGQPIDGLLFTRDIVELELSADLVVLSACRSGGGTMIRGEGVVGLARGFLQAGASQVLVSHWRIDDSATAELMKFFYRNLLVNGDSPPLALRKAQASMRHIESWSSPYYWAGFSLLGDWRAMNESLPSTAALRSVS